MASTISNSTLTVTISENLILNGTNQGSTKKMTISGINEISKRILTVVQGTSNNTQIYAGATAASNGTFITNDVKYIRITNLDNQYSVVLNFSNGSDHNSQFLLAAGQVFIITDTSASFDNNSTIGSFSGENITKIEAMGVSGAVDVEILVASA